MSGSEWVTTGAPCVLVTPHNFGAGTATIERRTVARTTARDVVLDNGMRLRRATLTVPGMGTWDAVTRLMHPDDPVVARYVQANAKRNQRNAVIAACDRLSDDMRYERKPDTSRLRALLDQLDAEATS